MAEETLRHNTASNPLADGIAPLDAESSSKDARDAPQRDTPVNMPLRQTMKQPVTQPRVHDITEKFTKACSVLEVGQLVKDEYFTLFESIGAIEIMDPKMDSGFLQPGETLEEDYDPLTSILPEEVIGIMDQLLSYEMAWHTGYPLSQTLFTSVYIDKLLWPETKTLEQAQFYRGEIPDDKGPGVLLEVLRAYCLALIKCCDFVIARVTSRDYFEEEDFCANTYNRVLFVQIPMDVFLRELDAAIEQLQDGCKVSINPSVRSAIIARLQFRKDFLSALDIDCPLEHIQKHWSPVSTGASTISTTSQLGKAVPGSFSTKIQRRLASTVPPRPIVELDLKDALEKLKQLCADCEEATRFTTLEPEPNEIQSFLWAFASRTPPPLAYSRAYLATIVFHPDILNQSTSFPLADVQSLVFSSSSSVTDPSNWAVSPPRSPHLPKPPRLLLALLIDEFIERAGQPYLDLWTALGQNRCRLRRMLSHVITAWDQLEKEAGPIDDDLMRVLGDMGLADEVLQYPLTTWVYHKKLWMIEKVVLLGFEQDTYLPDEYAEMYYFLSGIAATRRALLSNVHEQHRKRMMQLIHAVDPSGEAAAEVGKTERLVASLYSEASGIEQLSGALYRFYTVLLYLGLLPCPRRPFSTEELRYELRMKPFLSLQPPEVLPFHQFKEHLQPFGAYDSPTPAFLPSLRNPESQLWTEIDACIKNAKEAFSKHKKDGAGVAKAEGVEKAWAKEVQSALASCIALGVAVAGVKNAAIEAQDESVISAKGLGIKVELPGIETGKRYAEGWVVGKVIKE